MGIETIIGLGVGGLVSSAFNFFGAKSQQEAAEREAEKARATGRQAAGIIRGSEAGARRDVVRGASEGQEFLEAGGQVLGAQKDEVTDIFAQERAAGGEALSDLQELLLGGGEGFQERLEADPGFQFRLGEGNKAISRAARAAGSFGGGANLKDFARFSQGLASSEADKIVSRLMGLSGIGAQAGRSQAAFGTQLAQSIAGNRGSQANLAAGTGTALGNIGLSTATGQANALSNAQAQATNLSIQAANAKAQQFSSFGSGLQNLGILGAIAGGSFGGGGGGGGGEEFIV